MLRNKSLVLLVALGLSAGACSDGDDAATDAVVEAVTVREFAFAPAQISIPKGTTVRWRNDDAFRHTATSGETTGPENKADGRFDIDLPERGSTGSFTFTEAGTYTYFCRQHNAMDGTITVS